MISNDIDYKMWDKITYPFLHFKDNTVEYFIWQVIIYLYWDLS